MTSEISPDLISCDHEWSFVDDSFDHEYGTEFIYYEECLLCGANRRASPHEFNDYDE